MCAWRSYGDKISKRFVHPASFKDHDLISRGAQDLKLPCEHTPRLFHEYAATSCATVVYFFELLERLTAFSEFESKIFLCLLLVIFGNTFLLMCAWRSYGDKISKRFVHPASFKDHDLISRGAQDLKLPCEHTPRLRMKLARVEEYLPYEEFWNRFLVPGVPCILSSSFTDGWKARKTWVKDGRPDIVHLRDKYGSCLVPVADLTSQYFDAHCKLDMTFGNYLDALENRKMLYLKDWHFTKDFPGENVYSVPDYFKSDWLNEYWEKELKCEDNYKFVYFGPSGSWTPLHADVFRSFSWSANVCGKKKWLLLVPGEEEKLDESQKHSVDEKMLEKVDVSYQVVIQEVGEVIFVPSNWHHVVWNLEDTISINQNWFNASNIHHVFDALRNELKRVENELEDCRGSEDWPESCQRLLKALFGMDFCDFYKLLKFIGDERSRGHGPLSDLDCVIDTLERFQCDLSDFGGIMEFRMSTGDTVKVLVQYVIVRGDLVSALKWPWGAVIAQACHAVTAVNTLFSEDDETKKYLEDMDRMHKVVLEVKDEKSLTDLAEKLSENHVKHKLWIEQPENIPTSIATRPYFKDEVQAHFKKLKLFKGT
ncbi:unnamed protein product [Notodromas monacha]|uniref:peptidyl-tRNA hydrolase n=1 Tax=Notodromas monacha TaxID=399045 RepID=A0A7R9BQF2_9CRUS|nr:unnamed protein product [Notodromas monacha]CAG0918410.1 unnamed protein product [Notodromas monacha]